MPKFSVIIPARNEEAWLPGGLEALRVAAIPYPDDVETIVVLNRCTDRTEEIARDFGAVIAHNDSKNLSMIRNEGARHATGEIIITVDADSRMAPNTLQEIEAALHSGKDIGGGVPIHPERWSLGIAVMIILGMPYILWLGVSAGLFWCYRKDFEALGGFNEGQTVAEDLDFAVRLKKLGKRRRQKYGTLRKAPLITSCRKFDKLGDWFALKTMVTEPREVWKGLRGKGGEKFADAFFYDFER